MAGLLDFFFNYEANEAITTPINYPYLIIMRISLSLIKCWPKKTTENLEAGAKLKAKVWGMIQNVLHLAFCVLTIVGTATYVMLHKKNMTFFELGHLYITLMLSCVVFSRLATLTFNEEYQVVANEFLNKIHLFYYKDNSEFSMQTHKQIHRVSHLFTLYVTGQMLGGLSLFNLTPMYNNYSAGKYSKGGLKNSTFDHSLYYSYPFNVSTDVRGYIFSNILHWFFSYIVSTWFCTLDLFLSVIVFHIWGHFKILLHDIDNFPKPSKMVSFKLENTNVTISNENYSPEELEQLADKLKKCIDYYREIISFTNKISEVFGPMLLAYYGFHQASGCLLLLECSQMTPEALARYLPLTLILFQQLIQLSIVFELVGTVSSKLNDAVYGLPWEDMDVKNRKTVAFFLLNVQEPVHVKALGLADVGVTSMTKILKTSMSFFTFLRSM